MLCAFGLGALQAQTIIELKPGGGVRAKTAEEYRKDEPGLAQKLRADSLQYKDNLKRALNALYRDSLNQAEDLLNEALRLRPNANANYIVRHYLGRISMARGNYRKAVDQLTLVLRDYPNLTDIRMDRAACFLEIKNAQAALEDCNALLQQELAPKERIRTLFLRSAAYTKLRHPDKAKTDLEEILRLEPQNESALLLLAFAYEGIGRPQEALNRLNLFVTSHPQSTDGLLARAELEEKLQMTEAARADYDKAIEIAPANAALYLKRAQLLESIGLKALAQKDIQKAISLQQQSAAPKK